MIQRLAPYFALAAVLALGIEARGANPPGALDRPPSNVMPAPVDMAPTLTPRSERALEPSGNPLWAIPLSALTATRERPLFLPSRRAPATAVAGPPVVAAPPPPPQSAEPEQPPLTLVGAIASDTEGFAVFLDQATNSVVRLKTGQDHSGWVLLSVKGREATLQKNDQTTTLVLPPPAGMSGEPASAPPPTAIPMAVPSPPPRRGTQPLGPPRSGTIPGVGPVPGATTLPGAPKYPPDQL